MTTVMIVAGIVLYGMMVYGMVLYVFDHIEEDENEILEMFSEKALTFVVVFLSLFFPLFLCYGLIHRCFKRKEK